jgi:hypothetical protein
MAPASTISRLGNNLYELNIRGFFPHPHWMVFLFSGLTDLKVSVLRGKAAQDRGQQWDASFRLDFGKSPAPAEDVNYISLTQKKVRADEMKSPRLSKFRKNRRSDGSIEVHFEGADEIGFLGRFLGELSLLALFPVELEINTVGGSVQDRIVLRGFGGLPPGEHIDEALQNLLESLSGSPTTAKR